MLKKVSPITHLSERSPIQTGFISKSPENKAIQI